MLISVIIATYNRCENLRTILKSLGELDVSPNWEWEAVVADNNSNDQTRAVIQCFADQDPSHFRYVFEGRQGKSHALNAGIREAKGDVLVFTDDDCIPDRHWLAAIADEFTAAPSISVVGGRVELYDQNHKPCTILTGKERVAIVSAGQILNTPHIFGCNMAIHRRALRAVEGFDPALGPATNVISSEDVDFLYRIFRAGFVMVYCPTVLVYHNHGRTTDAEIEALMRGYFVGRGALYFKHAPGEDIEVLKLIYWDVRSCFRDMFRPRFSRKSVKREMAYLWRLCIGATRMFRNYCWISVTSTKRGAN